MKQITISATDAGQRFDKYLVRILPGAGRSFLYKMLRKKNIVLNGKKAEGNECLNEGDEVKLFFSDETYAKFTGAALGKDVAGGSLSNGAVSGRAASDGAVSDRTASDGVVAGRVASDGVVTGRAASNGAVTGRAVSSDRGYSRMASNGAASLPGKMPEIVFENEHILAMNKPVGMLSQKAEQSDISAVEYVADYLRKTAVKEAGFKPSVSNRLDRNTSGLLLAGKTIYGQRMLAQMLKDRSLQKYYLCIVKGEVKTAGRADAYLTKNENTNTVQISLEGGEEKISTAYRPLAVTPLGSLLEVELITGKSHQIRAQMAYLGHPIAGDPKYGDKEYNSIMKERFGVRRQILHARKMVFPKLTGPLSDISEKTIETALPTEIEHFCRAFGINI